MIPDPLILYKKNPKRTYSSYGIPFECVELVRRYFTLYYGLTFPSIPDAFDMFTSINSLIHINTSQVILLETVFNGTCFSHILHITFSPLPALNFRLLVFLLFILRFRKLFLYCLNFFDIIKLINILIKL